MRRIEPVPAALIALLEAAGKLPLLPDCAKEDGTLGRHPLLSEVVALKWVLAWHGPAVDEAGFRSPVGVAAFRDVYDYPTGRDVREVVHLTGSRRAIVDLFRWMREDAKKRPLIGSVSVGNDPMNRALEALDCYATRKVWEADPWDS